MRRAVLATFAVLAAGCSTAHVSPPDGGTVDAAPGPDATPGPDAATDAAIDAGGCTIASGDSPTLDGDGDLAAYPASQLLTPGVPNGAGDRVAITWDPTSLYVTVTSPSFANAFKPLHIYIETATPLAAPTTTMGKEYGGDTPFLPFAATHLIAIRRTDDGGAGAYDGVYLPGTPATFTTRTFALVPATHVFASADGGTLSVRTPWSALGGCPTAMRLAVHVVHGDVGNDWKDTVPTTHTPWLTPGGGYYQVDLTADPAIAGWSLH